MKIHKKDVLSIFERIAVQPRQLDTMKFASEDGPEDATWLPSGESWVYGYRVTLDGNPYSDDPDKADDYDYVVVPILYMEDNEDLIQCAWDCLCATVGSSSEEILSLMSATYLETNVNVRCVIPNYQNKIGIAVFPQLDSTT